MFSAEHDPEKLMLQITFLIKFNQNPRFLYMYLPDFNSEFDRSREATRVFCGCH